jgi:DNA-binding NarL/FixJ family response regulator
MDQHAIRVFLVDDHEVVRRGMRNLFKDDETIKVIGEAATAHEAGARIPVLRPHVAVLEVQLPDGSGIDLCRRLRAADPAIRVLMLTGYDDDVLFDAVSAGAAGYLAKSMAGTRLLAAIHAVACGERVIDSAFLPLCLKWGQGEAEGDGLSSLSATERRILTLLTEGLTNREIGDRVALSEGTVKIYVTKVLATLGVENRTQAAVIASRAARSDRSRTVAGPSRGVDLRD